MDYRVPNSNKNRKRKRIDVHEKTRCIICGKTMRYYCKANYDMKKLDSFGFASRKVPEYMHYELLECTECRFLTSVNTLQLSELASKYQEADFDSSREAENASKTYIKNLKKIVPDFPKKKVMDIGTGEGSYLKYLLLEGCTELVGVEPSSAPIATADEQIRKHIINDVFRVTDYPPKAFGMISCFQTIEHIPDPEVLCKDIYSLLRDGGLVYIVCHDYTSLVNKILGMKSPIYDIEHLQIFSKKSICRLLKKSGFENITIFTIKNKYPIKYWIRLFPFPANLKSHIIRSVEKRKWGGKIEIGINVGNIGVIAWKHKTKRNIRERVAKSVSSQKGASI